MLNYVALDKTFHSLADPTRRYMIECLCDGEASVSWLAQHLSVFPRSSSIWASEATPVSHASGIRSTLAAQTKSFSESPRIAWVV
jgi:DNA-binding transcriptional ArsR family regulator